MPIAVNELQKLTLNASQGSLEDCSLEVKDSLEQIIGKWATTIDLVIQDEPFSIFKTHPNPMPSHEFQFWTARLKNLDNIWAQLNDSNVKNIAIILEQTNSVYVNTFKETFKNVAMALDIARDVSICLTPLVCLLFSML